MPPSFPTPSGATLRVHPADAQGRPKPGGCHTVKIVDHALQRLLLATYEPEADDAAGIDGALRRVADQATVEALEVSRMGATVRSGDRIDLRAPDVDHGLEAMRAEGRQGTLAEPSVEGNTVPLLSGGEVRADRARHQHRRWL